MDTNELNAHVNYRLIGEIKHLYHGSKNGIHGRIIPDFKLARNKTDFGRGFYLGGNPVPSKALICGQDDYHPVFYEIDFDLTGLKCVHIDDLP